MKKHNLYETLGVHKTSDKQTIKRAYRRKVKKLHPDKGGEHDEFLALQHAFDVLGNDARRARYDNNGDDTIPKENEALGLFVSKFTEALEANPQSNCVRIAQETLENMMQQFKAQIEQMHARLSALDVAVKSYKQCKQGEDNVIVSVIQQQQERLRTALIEAQKRLRVVTEAVDISYHYKFTGRDLAEDKKREEESAQAYIQEMADMLFRNR